MQEEKFFMLNAWINSMKSRVPKQKKILRWYLSTIVIDRLTIVFLKRFTIRKLKKLLPKELWIFKETCTSANKANYSVLTACSKILLSIQKLCLKQSRNISLQMRKKAIRSTLKTLMLKYLMHQDMSRSTLIQSLRRNHSP